MEYKNEIPLIGPSIWEDLADSWGMLAGVLMALAAAYKFIELPVQEYWFFIFGGVLSVAYLCKVVARRKHYSSAVLKFSEYPPQRGRAFTCEIHFPELFEVEGAAMIELQKSEFDGSGANESRPYWAEARRAGIKQIEGNTIFSFGFTIPRLPETAHHYQRWWDFWHSGLDGKWKLVIKAKRKDGKSFPRRRYIEVWD